jgi:hypothetical protein
MMARPERVPAEEVRQRMLDAGRQLAEEAGAALTIEHLRLEEVIQRARVPRSSVYRMWAYREDYIDDLLVYLAGSGSWFRERPVLDPRTFDAVGQILTDNAALLTTPAGRRALLCEIVRIVASHNYATLTDSVQWRLRMALIATLGSTRGSAARQRIAAALGDSQRAARESMVAILGQLSAVLGLRLRDPAYTLDHVQLAGGLFIQSLAMRNVQVQAALTDPDGEPASAAPLVVPGPALASPGPGGVGPDPVGAELEGAADAVVVDRLLNVPIPGPGLHGEPAEWSLAAYGYLGVLDAFFELDPDFAAPAGEPAR